MSLNNFVSFNTFLVIIQAKWFALYFTTQFQYPRGKSNCCFRFGLIPVFSDNTKSRLALKKFTKVLQNHHYVTSKHIVDHSKTQWTVFCFKNKTQLALSMKMVQIKKGRIADQFCKKDYSVRHSSHQFYP